ncbi:MAG: hypothetical protein HZB56_13520 [Deltaproteobacteria bacterium]|nr:hypothetical protein [Deltaproteobacteria bacterium]
MNRKHHLALTWLGIASLALFSSACGSSDSHSNSTGQALTESSSAAVVTLQDSSGPSRSRAAPVQDDGSFTLDMAGLTAPYLLRAEWTDAGAVRRLYGVSEGRENLDVNALTDVAFRGAHDGADDSGDDAEDDGVFERSDHEGKRGAATRARLLLTRLQVVLGPLFERYGISDPRTDRDAVRALLRDVRIAKEHRTIVVTNRATGGVIFTGSLADLSAGTFTAANMPAGPGVPPAGSCTAFTYSDFGACQADGTQTRTVLTATPAGCTGGSPVLTQTCTYVPPASTCTAFTYSDFGACQADGTQTRTVLTATRTSGPARPTGRRRARC